MATPDECVALRDQFAEAAMCTLLSLKPPPSHLATAQWAPLLAEAAYMIANAMIEARDDPAPHPQS
jgi:hypothetical protein